MSLLNQCRRCTATAVFLLLPVLNAYAGTITAMSVSESSLDQSAVATYTFTFTPATTINQGMWSDGAYFFFNLDDDFVVTSTVLDSITPPVTGMNINGRIAATSTIRMYSGNSSAQITAGQSYTVVISGLQNPATVQTPVNHIITTGEGSGTVDSGSLAAHAIVAAATTPSVTSPIPDVSGLEESAGVTQYIADLNNHFTDGDGDTLTFGAISSDPSTVAVTLSGADNRTLSLEALKYGSADITVTASSANPPGSVDDTFNVTTIGALTINSISSTSDVAGAATDLVLNFTLGAVVSDAGGDGAYLYFDLPTGYGVGSASIAVTSPAVAGTTNSNAGSANVWFIATPSTIAAGTYTATISGVTNPGAGGSYDDIILDTRNGGGTTYEKGSIALPAIASANAPTVTTPISDQIIAAEDGATIVEADLNNVFTDGDADPLTFTVEAGHDTAIATASITGDELSVTGVATGTTTITIKADDFDDGSVTDSFDVTVLGLLTPADVQPASLTAGATGDVTITLSPDTTLIASDQIVVVYPAGFTVNTATLGSVSPATATLNLFANASNSVLQIASGSFASASSISITLQNITNPGTAGPSGDYTIRAQDSGDTVFAIATVAGGTLLAPEPEMVVKGNNVEILSGDTSPDVGDHTDFGGVEIAGGTMARTFTIENTGSADLNLTGISWYVDVTGTGFSLTSDASSPIASGGGTSTFTITFDPSVAGPHSGSVSIDNDDSDEDPYTFDIAGTGTVAPEMKVVGNGIEIIDGDVDPDVADHTDFGNVEIAASTVTRTFTIENTGSGILNLTAATRVAVTGTGFGLSADAPASLLPLQTGTFEVTFDPSAVGTVTGSISIANDDADEDPYSFSIQGTGTAAPEIVIEGNLVEIASGDLTPSTSDHTDFGYVIAATGSVARTFTIRNIGSQPLALTDTPRVALTGTGFTLTTDATTPVASAGSITFVITFAPSATGLSVGTVSVASDDLDENPYTFSIQGTGYVPAADDGGCLPSSRGSRSAWFVPAVLLLAFWGLRRRHGVADAA